MSERIDSVELPGSDLPAAKSFYSAAFGWRFADYGPHYAGITAAGLDGGLDAMGGPSMRKGPLVVVKSGNLEDARARVLAAGGTVT